MLSYTEARQKVIEVAGAIPRPLQRTQVEIEQAFGRILTKPVLADRDYPPFDRSTRDGFAVRSADAQNPGARLECVGELRAGGRFEAPVLPGQCVEIMTGAGVPQGTDAVVMIEHTKREGRTILLERAAQKGDHIVLRGSEAREGALLVAPKTRLGYAEMALAAQAGATRLDVFALPQLAILSTGDEVVDARSKPGPLQVRNSNGISIEILARTAGAETIQLGNAPDEKRALRAAIERGLGQDILVLSGGVSMGKYDLVEQVLADLGAEFHYTGVSIRPGRPAVFGTCRNKLVFGLPGNPVSTMVTFELFVLPAVDVLSGATPRSLPVFRARLATPVHEKGPVTHFLPSRIEWEGREARVSQLPWQGSGDIVALALANGFLIVTPDRPEIAPGEWVDVLPRRGAI
ncbi:MAG TPA: gephyrin-like molybdotransferase Glp [Candidatus Acidoferrum sp.]|nr:gephyrin-like molybdotransferase Glp [Candidatus Acidoferrum sp.]